jgi:ribosome maturation factor RimP
MDVSLDRTGNTYVVHSRNSRIQFYLAEESSEITIADVKNHSRTNSNLLDGSSSMILDNQLNR